MSDNVSKRRRPKRPAPPARPRWTEWCQRCVEPKGDIRAVLGRAARGGSGLFWLCDGCRAETALPLVTLPERHPAAGGG